MKYYLRIVLFLLMITLGTSISAPVFADGTYTVTRGTQSTPLTLSWNVIGGSQTCAGTSNYGISADGIKTFWTSATHPQTGTQSFNSVIQNPGTYTFTCTDQTPPNAYDTATLIVNDCSGGKTWNGTDCVSAPSGSFSPVPADCYIADGASTCTTHLYWDVDNATTTVSIRKNGSQIYTGASGTNQPATVTYGTNTTTFTIYTGGATLDTETVSGICTSGTSWTGTTCESPTGSFSGMLDCTIISGSSTCTTSFGWSTSNSTTTVNIQKNGSNIYSGTSGSNKNGTVAYGTNATTFTINTGPGYILDTETVSGACSSTTTWDAGAGRCWGADLTAGSAIPTTATQGVAVTLSAKITNTGKFTTGASFNNFFQVATSSNGGGNIQDLAYVAMSTLGAGASATTSKSYTFTSLGIKSIRACADKNSSSSPGVIKESDENNNCGAWVNVTVAAPPVSGSFNPVPPDCLIISGSSTCTTTFGWNTSNATSAVEVKKNGTQIYTGVSGTNKKGSVSYGTDSFTLVTGGATLDTETVTASCDATSVWDSGAGKCIGTCPNGADNPPDCDHGGVTGTLDATPNSCIIATGASTCVSHLSWSTVNPIAGHTSAVTRDGTFGDLYTGNNNADQPTAVPFELDGVVIYRLYHNSYELDTTSVGVTCAAGGAEKWDTDGNVCADPLVVSVTVNGTYGYGGSGSLDIVCANSNSYEVVRDLAGDNEIVDSGPYTTATNTPLSVSDNYSVFCKHGTVSSSPTTVRYDTPPPPRPLIFINATPKTMDFQGKSAVNWVVQYPEVACAISAHPVCTNGVCTQAQLDAAAVLNNVIATENTDADDQGNGGGGLRSITTAVSTIAPGHEDTDYKALGKKTFTVTKSTDFTIDCGGGDTATTRVRITNSNEE